jgi:hypothetical protein
VAQGNGLQIRKIVGSNPTLTSTYKETVMKITPQRLWRITYRWFLTFAVVSFLVNISYNGVRCWQEKIPSCDPELKAQTEERWQAYLALKNADKIKAKQEENFWLTVMSLEPNEVIVATD